MEDEACCCCAKLLSRISPIYDFKTEKPAACDRRLPCCSRVICGACIYVHPNLSFILNLTSRIADDHNRITPDSQITAPSAKSPQFRPLYPKVSETHLPIPRHPHRLPNQQRTPLLLPIATMQSYHPILLSNLKSYSLKKPNNLLKMFSISSITHKILYMDCLFVMVFPSMR